MHRPRIGPLGLAATVGAAALVAMALPASAHVTVNPNTATQGGYTKLTFRVPTEEDNASTVKVQVFFPTSQPLASVSVKPHPGWTFKVTDARLAKPVKSDDGAVTQAVSEITWTADSPATAIKPGEFDEFDVSAGPLPTSSSMVFKALQTYSSGEVVRWIDPTTPGAAEPEHPAPVLTLTPADAPVSAGTSPSVSAADPAAAREAAHANSQSKKAIWLAVIALVVGLAGGAVGGVGLRKRG